jgi:hypothetical protein
MGCGKSKMARIVTMSEPDSPSITPKRRVGAASPAAGIGHHAAAQGKWTFKEDSSEVSVDTPNVQRIIKICGI